MKKSISPFSQEDGYEYEEVKTLISQSTITSTFERVVTHEEIVLSERNTVWVYSRLPSILDVYVVETFEFELSSTPPALFWDFITAVAETEEDVNGSLAAVRVVASDQFNTKETVGYYLIESNVLITSDWSHNRQVVRAGIEVANALCNFLVVSEYAESTGVTKNVKREPIPVRVLVGCDPEWEMMRHGDVTSAGDYMGMRGQIGTDGTGDQVEMRPQQSDDVGAVVDDITRLMRMFSDEYNATLSVRGDHYPLGGHIHIGLEPCRLTYPGEMTQLFDDFLGAQFEGCNGESRGSYGRLGSVESKSYGFEYRSLPAAIFENPRIAGIVMSVMQGLTKTFFETEEHLIEYEDNPTDADYINIAGCSEEDVAYLRGWASNYWQNNNHDRVVAAWLDEEHVERPEPEPIALEFTDTWRGSVRQAFRNGLDATFSGRRVRRIRFYGYAESRGLISNVNFPENDWDLQDDGYGLSNPRRGSTLSIGLPWAARRGEGAMEHVGYICRTINRIVAARNND